MLNREKRLFLSLIKELEWVGKRESKLLEKAGKGKLPLMLSAEEKIPEGIRKSLKKGFLSAFGIILRRGTGLIEKSLNKDAIDREFMIGNICVETYGTRKELKRLRRNVKKSDFAVMAVTAAEGIGLGVLGIGIPDIVIFLATVFRGIYETALKYGFGYSSDFEKYFMLTLVKAALSRGEEMKKADAEANSLINHFREITEKELENKTEEAANAFAFDLLILKFIQGIPVAGVLGGAMNPVYYSRIMKYIRLKYYKRYIISSMTGACRTHPKR